MQIFFTINFWQIFSFALGFNVLIIAFHWKCILWQLHFSHGICKQQKWEK